MLTELYIRDLAIIERLRLDFRGGLTVLTGETGAGKSILLDALKLATGERADSLLVRHGAGDAEVVARFEVPPDLAEEARDGELLLRRVVSADGRSRAYVNDTPCLVGRLREIGDRLLEIHGQNEHFRLTRAEAQLGVVDAAAGADDLAAEVSELAGRWRETRRRLDELQQDAALSDAERELIAYQVEELAPELDAAAAVEELHDRHRRLASRRELLEIVDAARDRLGDSVGEALAEVRQRLQRGTRLDGRLAEALDLVDAALIGAQEAEQALNGYRDDLEDGEDDLAGLEARLERLHDLARKHRVEVAELPERHEELARRLELAANAEEAEARLGREVAGLEARWREAAARLSAARSEAARNLAGRITGLMHELGMAEGRFEIAIEADPERSPSPQGHDTATFLVSANAGQPPRALSRVASGGELSRIGLAISVAGASADGPHTLIFDEVDAGVGGRVAAIVGDRLRLLADGRQVLCVTHLAQVAARGQQHCRVTKRTSGERTVTEVIPLETEERVAEIARMLGGREVTERTQAHAREMLELDASA